MNIKVVMNTFVFIELSPLMILFQKNYSGKRL